MKSFTISAIAVGAFACAAVALGGAANAAPTGSSADQTIAQLQSDGYRVIVNKIGATPISQCAVSAVRPGHTYTRMDSGVPGAGDDLITTVTDMTVYVDLTC